MGVVVVFCDCLNVEVHVEGYPVSQNQVNFWKEQVRGFTKGTLSVAGIKTIIPELVVSRTQNFDWTTWKTHHCTGCDKLVCVTTPKSPGEVFINEDLYKREKDRASVSDLPVPINTISPAFKIVLKASETGEILNSDEIETTRSYNDFQREMQYFLESEQQKNVEKLRQIEQEMKAQMDVLQMRCSRDLTILWNKVLKAAQQQQEKKKKSLSRSSSATGQTFASHIVGSSATAPAGSPGAAPSGSMLALPKQSGPSQLSPSAIEIAPLAQEEIVINVPADSTPTKLAPPIPTSSLAPSKPKNSLFSFDLDDTDLGDGEDEVLEDNTIPDSEIEDLEDTATSSSSSSSSPAVKRGNPSNTNLKNSGAWQFIPNYQQESKNDYKGRQVASSLPVSIPKGFADFALRANAPKAFDPFASNDDSEDSGPIRYQFQQPESSSGNKTQSDAPEPELSMTPDQRKMFDVSRAMMKIIQTNDDGSDDDQKLLSKSFAVPTSRTRTLHGGWL
eukprot:TRINITY_DN4925_c0_g1_i1.p1 TRINITY_DN4925_c0_g1~~TRINITY_DN4925_c0_g1_i1.p1  ORF type:complete len:503 (-),score=236.38 TRINITY_DN4925_c0_g1_i1:42-1550(-)